MVITNSGADYSASGLGNSNFIRNFASVAGITNEAHITALTSLYNSCVSAGFWDKIGGIAFFPGSTATTQKYIFKKVNYGDAFPEIVFTGNGSSVDGWTPASGVYGQLPYTPPDITLNNVSLGIYNNTAEAAPNGALQRLLSMRQVAAPINYRMDLTRWESVAQAVPLGRIGVSSSTNTVIAAGADPTEKGLLQVIKDGSVLRIISNGVTLLNNPAATQTPVGGGTRKLLMGCEMDATGVPLTSTYAKARLALVYWGSLSLTDAVTFNPLVNTFLTAIGRAAV